MDITLGFLIVAGLAVVFAGISKGGFGSGAAFASASILALVVEPGLALGIMLPMLMLIDLATLKPYWGKWRWSETRLLILGGVPGVALGAGLYTIANADVFRVLIGSIAVLFVAWQAAQRAGRLRLGQRRMPNWFGGLMGVATGFTSFVSHAGGPPAAVFLLGRGMTKTEYQASSVLLFWAINATKFIPYAALGLFTQQTAMINLALAPFALLGAWLGVKAHHLVPERAFFALTYVLLLVTGTKLVWDGMSGLLG